jgi:hypothetical protein
MGERDGFDNRIPPSLLNHHALVGRIEEADPDAHKRLSSLAADRGDP